LAKPRHDEIKRQTRNRGQQRFQPPGFDQTCFRVDGERSAMGKRQGLQTLDFSGGHVDEHFVVASAPTGDMVS
jgi:hypothetical protein